MEVAVLSSGGKDSSLVAYILDKLDYDVRLINANFGVTDSWKLAEESADSLGFEFEVERFDRIIAERAADMIISDGFPQNGINYIHKYVLEETAKKYDRISDGTRREDRVPKVEIGEIRSIEDKYDVEYIAPLRGIGYKTLKFLTRKYFKLEEGESKAQLKGDYENELRAIVKNKGKLEEDYFPSHVQSRVIGRI